MEHKETNNEITFCEMREKEIINLFDGKRLGRVLDLMFNASTNQVLGIIVPGIRKLFSRKAEDLFIPLEKIEKIGDDVILVRLEPISNDIRNKNINEENTIYSKYQRELNVD